MQTAFDRLAPSVQQFLGALTGPTPQVPSHVRVIRSGGFGGKIFGIVFGFLVVAGAILIGFTDHQWRDAQPVVVGVGCLLGLMLVVFQWASARRLKRSRVRPAFILTPIIAARVGTEDSPVSMYYLRDLQGFTPTHHLYNGSYTHTAFAFTFADGALNIDVRPRASADELLNYLRETRNMIQTWIDDGSAKERLTELDWIASAQANPQSAPPGRPLWDRGLVKLAASAVLAIALTGASWAGSQVYWEWEKWESANSYPTAGGYRYYIDHAPLGFWKKEAEKLWDDTLFKESQANAASLRSYITINPGGAHVGEARRRVQELYAEAERKYLDREGKPTNEQAAAGMRALLRHLAEQLSPRVIICFAPSEGTDGEAAVSAIREMTQSSKVHGWGTSFTAEQNRMREGRIISSMAQSFLSVLANDLFDLQPGTMQEEGPRFLVRYRVLASGTYYQDTSQAALPLAERDVYPGVRLEFDFSLQVPGSQMPPDPDPAKGFRFHTAVLPAAEFLVTSSSVYDTMVETAFVKFAGELAVAYGFQQAEAMDPAPPDEDD